MTLEGKVAIITGAASGIGRSIARRMAEQGASLVLSDIDEGRLAKVHGEVGGAMCLGSVAEAEDVRRIVDTAMEAHGRVDILCNNAGVLDNLTPAADTEDDLWEKVMAVNLTGPFQLTRAVLGPMVAQGSGTIVNTASASGLHGGRGGCSYTASKHGLVGLTRSVAWYYGLQGIRCNAVAPGAVQTRMANMMAPHMGGFERYSAYFATIPPHGKAMQIADAVCFLASDASSYINGAVLPVDGGWSAF